MRAYKESYVDEAMENMGEMFEYLVCDCGYNLKDVQDWFAMSKRTCRDFWCSIENDSTKMT